MKTAITIETAGAVKARQGIVPGWMDAFADADRVVVVTGVAPFGRYTLQMRPACDATDGDGEVCGLVAGHHGAHVAVDDVTADNVGVTVTVVDRPVDEHDIATEHAPIDGGDMDDAVDEMPAGFHIVGRPAPPPPCFRPKACDTCGERLNGAAAEVVRDGRHVLVHADTCMRDGEEVA